MEANEARRLTHGEQPTLDELRRRDELEREHEQKVISSFELHYEKIEQEIISRAGVQFQTAAYRYRVGLPKGGLEEELEARMFADEVSELLEAALENDGFEVHVYTTEETDYSDFRSLPPKFYDTEFHISWAE